MSNPSAATRGRPQHVDGRLLLPAPAAASGPPPRAPRAVAFSPGARHLRGRDWENAVIQAVQRQYPPAPPAPVARLQASISERRRRRRLRRLL